MEVLPLNGNQRQSRWKFLVFGLVAIAGLSHWNELPTVTNEVLAPSLNHLMSSYVQPYVVERIYDAVGNTYHRWGLHQVRFVATSDHVLDGFDCSVFNDSPECPAPLSLKDFSFADIPAFIESALIPPMAPRWFHVVLNALRVLKQIADLSVWCFAMLLFGFVSFALSSVSLVSFVMRIPRKLHLWFNPSSKKDMIHVAGLPELIPAIKSLSTNFNQPASGRKRPRRLPWGVRVMQTIKRCILVGLPPALFVVSLGLAFWVRHGAVLGAAILLISWYVTRPAPVQQSSWLSLQIRDAHCVSRASLVYEILRQTRLGHYPVERMYKAVVSATRNRNWHDRQDFLDNRKVAINMPSPSSFVEWMLTFKLSAEEIKARKASAVHEALAWKGRPVRSYNDTVKLLGSLDRLPYLFSDWRSVVKQIIDDRAFPADAKRVIRPLAHSSRNMFEFFAILDSHWDTLCPPSIKGSRTRKDNTHVLVDRYVPLHGVPNSIQTDNAPQFKSRHFQALLKHLGAELKMGVAYHQQSNGRVENRNKMLKTFRQLYVSENSDWIQLLPMGEFALNAQPSTSLDGRSSFEVDLGYVPHMPSSWTFPTIDQSTRYAEDIREMMDRSLLSAKAAVNKAHDHSKAAFDRRHLDVEFDEGDEVFVDCSVVPSHEGVNNAGLDPKLRSKFIGPFRIAAKQSPVNYWVDIPGFQGQQWFHISQLRRKQSVPDGFLTVDRKAAAKPRRFVNQEEAKKIQGIFGHQRKGRGWLLSIKYDGVAESETVLASQLVRIAPEMVVEYAERHGLDNLAKPYRPH